MTQWDSDPRTWYQVLYVLIVGTRTTAAKPSGMPARKPTYYIPWYCIQHIHYSIIQTLDIHQVPEIYIYVKHRKMHHVPTCKTRYRRGTSPLSPNIVFPKRCTITCAPVLYSSTIRTMRTYDICLIRYTRYLVLYTSIIREKFPFITVVLYIYKYVYVLFLSSPYIVCTAVGQHKIYLYEDTNKRQIQHNKWYINIGSDSEMCPNLPTYYTLVCRLRLIEQPGVV